MPTEGATAIVFNADRTHVLLVKREDFRVWVLPGGKYFPSWFWLSQFPRAIHSETQVNPIEFPEHLSDRTSAESCMSL